MIVSNRKLTTELLDFIKEFEVWELYFKLIAFEIEISILKRVHALLAP